MKNIFYIILFSNISTCYSQIGVNTTKPESILHVHSLGNSLPIMQVKSENHQPILTINDNRNIGVNSLNDDSATLIISSEVKGNSGVRLFNHNKAIAHNNLNDLAVNNSGIVVSRGQNIGKSYFAFKTTDSPWFNSSNVIEDTELVLELPQGKYELTGSIVFYSGTNNDLELFITG